MPITQTRDVQVARADMNDNFGVTCYQDEELVSLTVDEARSYAEEILRAASEAEAVAAQDDAEMEMLRRVTRDVESRAYGSDRDLPEAGR